MSGQARGLPEPDGAPPVVRVRVSCSDASEYHRTRAHEFEMAGIVVPSKRVRPLGTRVRLKVELADGTLGYDGEAVVAAHKVTGRRRGYILRLLDPAEAGSIAPPSPPAPAPASAPGQPRGAGATGTSRPPLVSLALPVAVEPTPGPPPLPGLDLVPLPGFDPLPGRPPEPGPLPEARRSRPLPPPLPRAPRGRAEAGAGAAVLARVELEQARPHPPAVVPRLTRRELPAEQPFPAADGASDGGGERAGRFRAGPLSATLAILAVALACGALLRTLGGSAARRDAAFADALRRADDRLRTGRLAGPAQDSALDHLLAARELRAADPRLTRRLTLLADTFGELGERARARGDLGEAATHFRAALRADPGREAVRDRLRELAARGATPAPGR